MEKEIRDKPIQTLELFGGVGAFRVATRNLGIDIKAIDYVEIDEKAVRSYNAMFKDDLEYKQQDVRGWNLKPDILVHGSPCQDISIAGKQGGADEGSETRSSLMWETINIIKNMGEWKPQWVIWENVKQVNGKRMKKNFDKYLKEMKELGYTNSYECLDARDFGLPQYRERVFTISNSEGEKFNFKELLHTEMRPLKEFLEPDEEVSNIYNVTQPSVLSCIGAKGIRRATVINEYAYTITTRQDRTPAQVIKRKNGEYRYLTEKECWRLQGYSDEDFEKAKEVQTKKGRYYMDLYRQAGNSIPVTIFESILKKIMNGV